MRGTPGPPSTMGNPARWKHCYTWMKKLKRCFIRDPWFHLQVYPLERTVGSFKRKRSGCQVCVNVNATDTFTSTVIKKTQI